jgi:hypothetical protein
VTTFFLSKSQQTESQGRGVLLLHVEPSCAPVQVGLAHVLARTCSSISFTDGFWISFQLHQRKEVFCVPFSTFLDLISQHTSPFGRDMLLVHASPIFTPFQVVGITGAGGSQGVTVLRAGGSASLFHSHHR